MQTLWKKFGLWGACAITLVIPTVIATLYYSNPGLQLFFGKMDGDKARDYQKIPFNSLDAALSCEKETLEKFSSDFLRSTVDWHSTRFQESRNVFIVVLDAHIGTRKNFEAAKVYCYVNPRSYRVSYFKAYDSNNKALLSNGIDLKEMLASFK